MSRIKPILLTLGKVLCLLALLTIPVPLLERPAYADEDVPQETIPCVLSDAGVAPLEYEFRVVLISEGWHLVCMNPANGGFRLNKLGCDRDAYPVVTYLSRQPQRIFKPNPQVRLKIFRYGERAPAVRLAFACYSSDANW